MGGEIGKNMCNSRNGNGKLLIDDLEIYYELEEKWRFHDNESQERILPLQVKMGTILDYLTRPISYAGILRILAIDYYETN